MIMYGFPRPRVLQVRRPALLDPPKPPDHENDRPCSDKHCHDHEPEDMDADAISNVAGESDYVRVQVLTPVGVLDRDKQLGVVKELTDIVANAAGDPSLRERTWVLLSESPEGGWGIGGHANTNGDIAAAARAELVGR
jgi:phenylpyruvate tautomerase PptA (4-oxalocrotonate tautomerase family)